MISSKVIIQGQVDTHNARNVVISLVFFRVQRDEGTIVSPCLHYRPLFSYANVAGLLGEIQVLDQGPELQSLR